jgi:Flp pilus assembly protein TadG
MLRCIQKAVGRLRRDERGNVFVLFGAASIPLLLVMGGAVDLARFAHYKAELSNAVDAAALALARQGRDYSEEEATEYVENYVTSFGVEDGQFDVGEFDVDETDNGFRVAVDGVMQTMFLPLGGMTGSNAFVTEMEMDIVAEVVHSSNRLELALVLDNTGSMNCVSTVTVTCATDWASP